MDIRCTICHKPPRRFHANCWDIMIKRGLSHMIERPCNVCGAMTEGWRLYCTDCYLRKEAGYGLWDLTHDDPKTPETTKAFLKRFAVERLINFTRYELEKRKV